MSKTTIYERKKTMWYVKLNDTILPTPYQYFSDCMAECKRLQRVMVAVFSEPVLIG